MLPESAYFQLTPDLKICRILNGLWQLSGGHGFNPNIKQAVPDMFAYHDSGLTTWDLADHYGPAESFIGQFRHDLAEQRGEAALSQMQAFTKWVPRPGTMSRSVVEAAIDVSRRRMGMPTLDLLQFHWWDYADTRYLDALDRLTDLQLAGQIRHLALTNFDTEHTHRIVEHGTQIVSNQVQFSLIDRRPEVAMIPFGQEHNITLLTYGTLCGGLLTDRYLAQPEPGYSQLNTASLRKYKQMIDLWGGWTLFQELLRALRSIADKHQVAIANVAVRYILDKPQVAGVIAGVRLGIAEHRADNVKAFDFALDSSDLGTIHAVTARSQDLFKRIGDCGDEYRG